MRLVPFEAGAGSAAASDAADGEGRAAADDDVALLLHGFGADRLSWTANAPALAPRCAVVAADLPGHGTALDVDATSVEAIFALAVDAVDALVDERAARGLGTRLHLVGHSLGGALAIALAAREETPVASLVVAAPAGLGSGIDVDWLEGLVALDDEERAVAHLTRLVADPRMISRQAATMLLAHLARPGVRDRLGALARDLDGLEARVTPALEAVAARGVPRACVWGELDAVNPADDARVAAFGGEDARYGRCGHLPQVERAARFNRVVLERIGAP